MPVSETDALQHPFGLFTAAVPAQNLAAAVTEQLELQADIRLMTVLLPAGALEPRAGQFYMLRAWRADEAPLLSRPISVHDYDEKTRRLRFLYQIKGEGTRRLAALTAGDSLRLTGPAGNGFPLEKLHGAVALVGGGIGTAPLLQLAQTLAARGCAVDFFAGYRDAPYALTAFEDVCRTVSVATDSGAYGRRGFVTDLFDPAAYTAVCACGPEVMMQKTARMCAEKGVPCYVSKEAKMACGVGACLGCTCHTKQGARSVCKNGPVFEGRDVYDCG